MDRNADPRLSTIQANWSRMHLTQHEAAQQLGISQPCLNQYLRGKIPLNTDMVVKFANLFDVSPSSIDSKLY